MSAGAGGLSRAARLLCVTLAALLALPVRALATDVGEPVLSEARAAIVCDQAGDVLWSRDADATLAPASITKVMTAMVALDSGKALSDVCRVHMTGLSEESQLVGFTEADTPTFGELLEAMLVFSGNDAANNVALNVCGSLGEFVDRMNEKAAALGMTGTHFANAHGLEDVDDLGTGPDERRDDVPYGVHYSTARDLAVMARHAMVHYPFIAHTVRLRSVTVTVGGVAVALRSTDDLMEGYAGLLGIKTGAVESGYTFLGASHRDGITLYTCVLGCSTPEGRFADTAALMDWAYGSFRDRSFARGSWALRVCGFADNFALKCVVRAAEGDVAGRLWPAGGNVRYRNLMTGQSLVRPGDAYGGAWWRQGGRLVCGGTWRVAPRPARLPSWPLFSLPLFADLDAAGVAPREG